MAPSLARIPDRREPDRTSAAGLPKPRPTGGAVPQKWTRLMLSFSLSLQRANGRTAILPPPPNTVSLTAFSRDRTLFDSGAAFGRNQAAVPLSGTGTAGMIVQGRAVSLDDGGATTTAWVDIATISGGGSWTGSLTIGRNASWLRPEVRLKADTAVTAQGTNRFGVGHVIAIWGQSEPDRIISTFYDNTTAPAVADPEAVQILYGAAATPARAFITTAQPFTAAAAAMAGTFISARPGEKFAVIFHTVPGTDPRALVNDSDTSRLWSADKALHDYATADGQKVGFAAMSWFAAPGVLGSSYGQALYPLFSGKLLDGTAVSFPTNITYGSSQTYHADHWFGELYSYTDTKWVPYGPHRFDIDTDMQDATHMTGGSLYTNLVNKQLARDSWRAMLAVPTATMFLPLGIEPTSYVNGYDDGAGGWTDGPHPAGNTADGTQTFARLTALAILESADLVAWNAPVFDNCLWDPAGAYVEVWSSAGAVTTTRLARGEAALGTTYPHWTTVMGFQINGQPAQNAQIVAGRVRIFKNGGGNFISTDAIQFGEGGATGQIKFPQDQFNATWKNLPIVNTGAAGLNGIPLRPLPAASVLANTIPAGTPKFTTSATGPYFLSPTNVPAGTTGITFAAKVRAPTLPSSSQILFSQANVGFDVELMNTGALRTNIKDGAAVKVLNAHTAATGLLANVWYDIVCAADHVSKNYWITINGTLFATVAFTTAGNGVFQSNRAVSFLARNAGALQFIGDVEYLKVWYSIVAGGAVPGTSPIKSIVGPASLANADSWKLGTNAT